jgi:hypothetical protein
MIHCSDLLNSVPESDGVRAVHRSKFIAKNFGSAEFYLFPVWKTKVPYWVFSLFSDFATSACTESFIKMAGLIKGQILKHLSKENAMTAFISNLMFCRIFFRKRGNFGLRLTAIILTFLSTPPPKN